MKIHDVNRKLFWCKPCDKGFTEKHTLGLHNVSFHGAIGETYKCEICAKELRSKPNLTKHLKLHQKDRQRFRCEFCNKEISKKCHLDHHIKKFHSNEKETFTCEICGKSMNEKGNLKKHMTIHAETRVKLQCPICPMTLVNNQRLKFHIAAKHQELPMNFECEVCQMKFAFKEYLKKHLESHNRTKSQCKICQKEVSFLRHHF